MAYQPPGRDRQRLSPTYPLAAVAAAGLVLAFVTVHVFTTRARTSVEIGSTSTQCYQGQPRRELFSMQLTPGVEAKVLQDRTIGLRFPPGEFQQQPDVVPKDSP
jgi:hypothetical protein